ncbi:MAG: hypothetical protein JW801_10745, partial [Bacteroidales bacterium]|nr:hypothetical protein [Bacteroidales bacterium]
MKKRIQKDEKLIRRMLTYAGSAGAIAALSTNASADVVYSGTQNILLSANEYYALDMDGDGVDDFGFMQNASSSISYSSFYDMLLNLGVSYNNSWIMAPSPFMGSSYSMVDGLSSSAGINSAQSVWGNIKVPNWDGVLGVNFTSSLAGEFINEVKYIGVRFYIGTEQHYGWIRASVSPDASAIIIMDWAYESTPGTGILAAEGLGPAATLTPDVMPRTNVQEVTVNVSFNEEATGLEIGDFVVVN